MRMFLISLQVALVAMLAISGALAGGNGQSACPLGEDAPAIHCEK